MELNKYLYEVQSRNQKNYKPKKRRMIRERPQKLKKQNPERRASNKFGDVEFNVLVDDKSMKALETIYRQFVGSKSNLAKFFSFAKDLDSLLSRYVTDDRDSDEYMEEPEVDLEELSSYIEMASNKRRK